MHMSQGMIALLIDFILAFTNLGVFDFVPTAGFSCRFLAVIIYRQTLLLVWEEQKSCNCWHYSKLIHGILKMWILCYYLIYSS